jgi:hypothetical protein
MAGGSAEHVDDVVDIHCATVALALERAGVATAAAAVLASARRETA